MPDLKPGDASWENTFPASGTITARLLTPTGYTVDKTNPAPTPRT